MVKYLEHRRHAERFKPGVHLRPRGVNIARKLGNFVNNVEFVITSDLPRASETAVAMGFAVNETWSELSDFSGYSKSTLELLQEQLLDRLNQIPSGGRVLVISHLGVVEDISKFLFHPVQDALSSVSLDYCEGVLLIYNDQKGYFVGYEILHND